MTDRNTASIEARLAALGTPAISGLAQQVLGRNGWDALRWRYERLYRTVGPATGGVYRIAGTADFTSEESEWSLILKVISPGVSVVTGGQTESVDSSHPLYWKREALAYQSGWLDHLPGGIRGPRCLATETQPDGSVWLWLEDVHDRFGDEWPLAQYARAARCLGRFNGAYLAGHGWPPYAWLSRTGTPRGVIDYYGWIEQLVCEPSTWDHPLLRAAFPASLAACLSQFWTDRHSLLAALDRMPQTLCHLDAWRGNMMAAVGGADDELVLIDWSYVGRAVLGTDLGDLAIAGYSLLDMSIGPAAIDEAVFDSYMDGLRAAGWPAVRNQVRFSYATCAALKYGCLLIWLRDVPNEQRHAFWEQVTGQRMDRMLAQQAIVVEHLLHLLDEARGLLEVL